MRDAAALLRKGGKLLGSVCPDCGSPLIQLKTGEVYCPREKKEVHIDSEGGRETDVVVEVELEKVLTQKLRLLKDQLDTETDPMKIKLITDAINSLLTALRLLMEKPRVK
jgi:uncharacterized Zn finger protein (UPF0148 family)